MPISGYIGGGAQDALAEVLDRRLKEQIRQQQEKQHADQIAIQRQQINLQQRAQESREGELAEARKRQQGLDDIATAGRMYSTLSPGDIDESQAGVMEKDPALAGLVRRGQRPLINARPITGTTPLDTSGPQSLPVVELRPTGAQAKQTALEQARRAAYAKLGGAVNEPQRRQATAEAGGEGIEVPASLTAPSQLELQQQRLETEKRANEEFRSRAKYQSDLIQGRETSKAGGAGSSARAYTAERARRTVQGVDNLIGRVSRWTVGRGSLLQYIPETEAADFAADLDTLKSNIAFGELSAMREASKTGGALGAISEKELALLESTLGALNTRQSPQNFRRNLAQIKDSIDRWNRERQRLLGDDSKIFDDAGGGDDDIDAKVDALLEQYREQ